MKADNLHYVIFDGTSAFVGSFEDINEDDEVLFKSSSLFFANNFCDKENNKIIGHES